MLKKTLIVGAVALAAAGIASADGFYVGAQLGGVGLHSKTTASTSFSGQDNTGDSVNGNASLSRDDGNLGVQGGLLAGYGWTFPNQFYLGAELFGDATSAKVNHSENENVSGTYTDPDTGAAVAYNSSTSYNSSLKLRYNYGVRVLPGYAITPDTTAYGIVGYVRGNFQASDSFGSSNFNSNGYQLGLGAMTNVAKNVAVRGDFIYSSYSSKSYSATVSDTETTGSSVVASGTDTATAKFHPNTLEANLAVVYKFG